jgi:hypothetical protein
MNYNKNNLRKSAQSADNSSADRDPETYAIIGAGMTIHRTVRIDKKVMKRIKGAPW